MACSEGGEQPHMPMSRWVEMVIMEVSAGDTYTGTDRIVGEEERVRGLARPSGVRQILDDVASGRGEAVEEDLAHGRPEQDSSLQRPLPSAVLGIRLLVPSGELDNQTDAAVEGDGGVLSLTP